jgi:epidermal growth factor receptor substrate 15
LTATASGVTNAAATGSTAEPSLPASKQTSAFDDLGDDFEGLEDAKEGSADDDFQTISRSGLDDFNPVFDSPPLASEVRDKSDLASATSGVGGAVGANAPFATDSGFDFGGTSVSPGTSNLSALTATDGSTAVNGSQDLALSDAHDWDAIFASLDDAAPPSSHPAIGQAVTKETGSGGRPGPPGRALTEEGEHDDPILKNLTSMGYSRTDALSALEKYDYNLERVSLPPNADNIHTQHS